MSIMVFNPSYGQVSGGGTGLSITEMNISAVPQLAPGSTHQLLVSFLPVGSASELMFINLTPSLINVSDSGLITVTGTSGQANMIVIPKANVDKYKQVSFTVG